MAVCSTIALTAVRPGGTASRSRQAREGESAGRSGREFDVSRSAPLHAAEKPSSDAERRDDFLGDSAGRLAQPPCQLEGEAAPATSPRARRGGVSSGNGGQDGIIGGNAYRDGQQLGHPGRGRSRWIGKYHQSASHPGGRAVRRRVSRDTIFGLSPASR